MVVSRGPFGQQIQTEGYHLALCKFLLRSLKELYPDLPIAKFSELVVFTVKDEVGKGKPFRPIKVCGFPRVFV